MGKTREIRYDEWVRQERFESDEGLDNGQDERDLSHMKDWIMGQTREIWYVEWVRQDTRYLHVNKLGLCERNMSRIKNWILDRTREIRYEYDTDEESDNGPGI